MTTSSRFRLVLLALVVSVLGGVLAACADDPQPVSAHYALTSYGEQIGSTHYCYWVDSPDEFLGLVSHQRCQSSWVPMRAPSYWLAGREPFYRTPDYYNVAYSDPWRRRTYVDHIVIIERQHPEYTRPDAVAKVPWKDTSTGKVVPGPTVVKQASAPDSKVDFGAGDRGAWKPATASAGGGSSGSNSNAGAKPASGQPPTNAQKDSKADFNAGDRGQFRAPAPAPARPAPAPAARSGR